MKQTILLLASDSEIRKALAKVLESQGYFVLAAGEIDQAVKYAREGAPRLLMLRHYTENVSGYDAAIYLRRLCPGVPVLLVGGILDDNELQNRNALHAFEVFPKPFTAAELLDKVKEVLASSSRNLAGAGTD